MQYLDVKYINLCGSQLRNFKRKDKDTYNCSCPICGDSEKKLSKARGFFLAKGTSVYYHCHNCGISLSFAHFLKKVFPLQYNEYILEKYKDKKETTISIPAPIVKIPLKKMVSQHATSIDLLDDAHYAKEYIKARMIPEDKLSLLYFTDDFAKLTEDLFPGQYPSLRSNDARIVIPFFNKQNEVIGLQGRSLDGDSQLRYITARANKEVALIFGQERLDLTKKVLVVEGPIDSLFLPNCLAVASSDLERSFRVVTNINDYVLVFDNEPRNKEIVSLVSAAVENNRTVCIWPQQFQEKDINDMVRVGHSKEEIYKEILANSFSGIRAKMKLAEWKRC